MADQACVAHDDCAMIVWDGPQPLDPCCDARVGHLRVHKLYLEWFGTYREQHCARVTCPPAPLPGAEPKQCVREARCVRGKCTLACDDPTYPNRAADHHQDIHVVV